MGRYQKEAIDPSLSPRAWKSASVVINDFKAAKIVPILIVSVLLDQSSASLEIRRIRVSVDADGVVGLAYLITLQRCKHKPLLVVFCINTFPLHLCHVIHSLGSSQERDSRDRHRACVLWCWHSFLVSGFSLGLSLLIKNCVIMAINFRTSCLLICFDS